MKILGVDPGSHITGYAVLEVTGATQRLLESGVLRGPRDASFAMRIAAIQTQLERLIARCGAEQSAVEDLFSSVHPRSALLLAHARGAILCALARGGLSIAEYSPRQVKMAVSGSGSSGKDDVRIMVARLLGVASQTLTQDASDAAAVALCHAQASIYQAALDTGLGRQAPGRGRRGGNGTRE